MTQEQKDKLEQAALDCPNIVGDFEQQAFFTGAQAIIDNPSEWGLYPNHQDKEWSSTIDSVMDDNAMLRAENTRYREALESIATRWNKVAEHNEMRTALHLIQQDVFEALKNNEG